MRYRFSPWAFIMVVIVLPLFLAWSITFRIYAYQVPFISEMLSRFYYHNGGSPMQGYIWLGGTVILFGLVGLVSWDFFRRKDDRTSAELKAINELTSKIDALVTVLSDRFRQDKIVRRTSVRRKGRL